jgi:phage baseplate assembly protein W
MNELSNTFLGRGWTFPPTFNAVGQVKMLSNETGIHNALLAILSTRVGERIMQPNFGCNLNKMLFEPLTTTLKTQIKDLVFMAIYNFEPRIKPLDVILTAKEEEGFVEIEVQYEIKATNSRYNLVYPFYIIEGREK